MRNFEAVAKFRQTLKDSLFQGPTCQNRPLNIFYGLVKDEIRFHKPASRRDLVACLPSKRSHSGILLVIWVSKRNNGSPEQSHENSTRALEFEESLGRLHVD